MLHLLKQSAKVRAGAKKRKVIPLLGSIQDFHKASQNITIIPPNEEMQPSETELEEIARK